MNSDSMRIEMELRQYHVPDDVINRVLGRLATVSVLESEKTVLQYRVQDLERLVPPELLKPQPTEPRYHTRSRWD